VGLVAVVVDQGRSASDRIDAYVTEESGQTGDTGAEMDVDRLQLWLDDHRLGRIQIREQARDFVDNIDYERLSRTALDYAEGAALGIFEFLFALVLIIVVCIYMLLDMPRLQRAVDRRFPPRPGAPSLLAQVESSVGGYVKGQVLVSLIIGTSAGLALWLLGTFGWLPAGFETYALLFGAWVAVTELIPYLGPWLGAIPPFIYGLVVDPTSALWVALVFLAIHQIEGHVVVPNVMGSALRLHPLLVIFGLLAGGEIYGLAGIFVALERPVVEKLLTMRTRRRPSLVAMIGCAGFPMRSLPVERAQRPEGESSYSPWGRLRLGWRAVAWVVAWKLGRRLHAPAEGKEYAVGRADA